MSLLKFWLKNDKVYLDKYNLENITKDDRTKSLKKETFFLDKYKIDENIYMVINDFFFVMAKFLDKTKEIHAMILCDDISDKKIIIVPSKSYIYWNGYSIDPIKYEIDQKEIKKIN